MTQMISCPPLSHLEPSVGVDVALIKQRQQTMWSSGDFAVIGSTLQIVGETLCEAVDLQSTQRVLDVACGNGNAALAAARRFSTVTGLDYVPALLVRAAERAQSEGFDVRFVEGDAEDLPFGDAEFDVVLSTYGVMFAPNHRRAADELLRVCRPGGKIGLANWTPEGFIGRMLRVVGRYVPPAAGVPSPLLWGNEAHLSALFGQRARIEVTRKNFVFRYLSPAHFVDVFRRYYGPMFKAYAALDGDTQQALTRELIALTEELNTATGALAIPAEYLEVMIQIPRG